MPLLSKDDRNELRNVIIWLLTPAAILLAVFLITAHVKQIEFWRFSRDLASSAGVSPLLGILSNLGILCWSFAVGATLLAWIVTRSRATDLEVSRFYLCSMIATLVLTIDDFFMVHEHLLRRYTGIEEEPLLVVYGVLMLVYLYRFRHVVLARNPAMLMLAFGLLSLSVLVDALPESDEHATFEFEDSPKFLGIVCWLGYFLTSARRDLHAPR